MAAPKPNALSWLGVSVLVILLDQWSKAWVLRALPEYTDIVVIPGFWNWFRTYNTGAAFSFLANSGGWQIWFFSILAFAISALLIWWLYKTPRGDWKTALPYALIIGGALGNVIDFIKWYVGDHVWPAFNLADAAIVAGAVGLVLFGVIGGKKDSATGK